MIKNNFGEHMAGYLKNFKYMNYIFVGSEPVPVESLTNEQIEKALDALQDSFMASQGYVRINNDPVQKDSL